MIAKLLVTTFLTVSVISGLSIFRVKRQPLFTQPSTGPSFPAFTSQLAGFPALGQPTIVQPAPDKPCPVALIPEQIGGNVQFGNPVKFGFNLAGYDKSGPWGTMFDGAVQNEYGGGIFGDIGHKPEDLPCKLPAQTAPSTGALPKLYPTNPLNQGNVQAKSEDHIVRALEDNPDLLSLALAQNPDLANGDHQRQQAKHALVNDPVLIRRALMNNPHLIEDGEQVYANRHPGTSGLRAGKKHNKNSGTGSGIQTGVVSPSLSGKNG